MKIPIEILVLLSPAWFEKRFHKNCQTSKSNEQAYEETEREYKKQVFESKKNWFSIKWVVEVLTRGLK